MIDCKRSAELLTGLFCALLITSSSGWAQTPVAKSERRPNILMIYVDDLGWRDVGFMGSDFYETPSIDAIANNGLVFTNAYAAAANCAPSRASLLSGQYSPRHKIYNVGTRPRGKTELRRLKHVPGVDILDRKIQTWAQLLQNAGYKTASMGKWHLSHDPKPYGFDVNVGGTRAGMPPRGYYPPHHRAPGLENRPADEYLTDYLSEQAVEFIQANHDRPWLLYLTHFAVHTPIVAKRELVQKYKNKSPGELHSNVEMATMVQSVDDGVGKIMKTLDRLGITDNTVVIFYSDNGGHGPVTDMAPLRGHKGTYYEGGIRVPFSISWPGKIQPGKTDEPIAGVDLFPTLIELAGVEMPDQACDGKSIVGLATGKSKTIGSSDRPRSLFWHFPAYLESTGGRRLRAEQRDPFFRSRPCGVIRQGKWKLIQFFEKGDFELYDLESDMGESKNLVDDQPEIFERLKSELSDWQTEVGADLPTEKNPKFDPAAEAKKLKAFNKQAG
jgi:arylsulfatase A-like enzyme